MGDLFLNMGRNRAAKKIVGLLGVTPPQLLERMNGPWEDTPLTGRTLGWGTAQGDGAGLQRILTGLGAELSQEQPDGLVHGLVFDARGVACVAQLRALYDFFHPRIRSMAKCSRVVVIGSDTLASDNAALAAATHALIGFVKSVSKEVGRKGSTANLILVGDGADTSLDGPLRFLLTPRSAFVTGQMLRVTGTQANGVWSRPLAGKTALVTGAARGIGAATARRLAAEGARVMVLDLPNDAEAIEELASELDGIPVPLNITDANAPDALLEAAGGPIDIVVHNAGITRDKTLAKMPEALWDLTLSVNLGCVLSVTEALLEKNGIAKDGRIVLVSSIAGIAGNVGQTNYAASKAGIVGLTHSLGTRLGEKGIAVNAVAPGFIETRLTRAIPFGIREVGRRLSNLNQGGIPLDIAEAITFLSSPGAGGLHGNVLRVCGGNLLGA